MATQPTLWFPAADPARTPSPWWYFGRAVYVSRRDYRRIFLAFVAAGAPFGVASVLLERPALMRVPEAMAAIGVLMLTYSLAGLYRMYGHPSRRYIRQLIDLAGVRCAVTVADLHIGTYRHAFALAEALPDATIHSIDCWSEAGDASELAVQDVRRLEPPPTGHERIVPGRADHFHLPLPDASCDVVVFGFGTHAIAAGAARDTLFAEARRVLQGDGQVLLFEHGYDVHNYLIFGPVIDHVTRRDDWLATMRRIFTDVRYARSSAAVDLIAARR
ncbi:MAG: methyltransferase domain-containing protein [Gemmatimonadaceae bacterium]